MTLLDEADALFECPGQPYNGFFYNEVTRLASLPAMESSAEDLRDRVLESMVRKLRQGVEGGQSAPGLVSALLGKSKLWPAPLVSDAEFAATARSEASSRPRVRARPRPAHDRDADQWNRHRRVPGFGDGRGVSRFRQRPRGLCSGRSATRWSTVAENNRPVVGLAVDPDGKTLVALCQSGDKGVLSCFRRIPDGSFRRRPDVHFSSKHRISGSPRSCPGAWSDWSVWARAENS